MRNFHTKFLYLLLFIFSVSDSYAAAEESVFPVTKAPVAKLPPITRTAIETSFSKTLKILPQMAVVFGLYLYPYPHEESAPVLRRRPAPKSQTAAEQETIYGWLAKQFGM
tara:strand:- start:66606 stop:66935 length:330 start_codon:yes stop_codon:yes gene_type:complete